MSDGLTLVQRGARAPHAHVDMTTTMAGHDLPEPGLHRLRAAPRPARSSHAFVDVASLGGVVTKSIMSNPRSGGPRRGWPRRRSGMLNSIGLQGPGIEHFLAHDLPVARRARGPRRGEHRRGQRRGVRLAGDEAARPARAVDGRGEHLLPERGEPRPGVRLRPARRLGRGRRGAPPAAPVGAGVREAQPGRHRHRRHRAGLRRRRRGRALGDQHPARDGHRHRHDAPRPRRRHRGPLRPGDPPGRGALRLPGPRRPAGRADPRHGRHPHRPGRAGVPARRGQRGQRRHRRVRRPRAPRRGCCAELAEALAARGIERLADVVGLAHRPPEARVPVGPDPVGDEDPA